MKRFRVGGLLLLVMGAVMVLVAPARSQSAPLQPADFDCPAGSTKYAVPRQPEPLRDGTVLPLMLLVGYRQTIDTGVTIPAGRLRVVKTVSWDGYLARPATGVQAHEQWAVQVGAVSTALTDDLPDGGLEATLTGSLPAIDQPGGVMQINHSSVYTTVTDSSSVHPVGLCWVVDQPYDLALTKSVSPSSVAPGGAVAYSITVTNNGPGTASAGWTVTDLLPAGLTATGSSTGAGVTCSTSATTVDCLGSNPLAPGDVVTIGVAARADITAGSLKNVAYVTPSPTDPPETIPLGTPPTLDTDTPSSVTNNDGQAIVTVSGAPVSSTVPTTPPPVVTNPATTTPPVVTNPATTTPPVVTNPATPTSTTVPGAPPANPAPTTTVAPPAGPAGPAATTVAPAPVAVLSPSAAAAEGTTTTVPAVRVLGSEIINAETGNLAITGSESSRTLSMGLGLMGVGAVLLLLSRVRRAA